MTNHPLRGAARPALLELCDDLLRRDSQAPCMVGAIAIAVHDGQQWHYWAAHLNRTEAKVGFVDVLPSNADVAIILGAREAAFLRATGALPPDHQLAMIGGDRSILRSFIGRYFQAGSWLRLQANPSASSRAQAR